MEIPFTYPEGKIALIEALTRDAQLHDARRFDELGEGYDMIDGRLPRNAGPEFNKLLLAHEFWGGWLDSSEHDWFFYEPIRERDWPSLARTIITDLSADREVSDSVVLGRFSPRPASRISRLLRRVFRTQ